MLTRPAQTMEEKLIHAIAKLNVGRLVTNRSTVLDLGRDLVNVEHLEPLIISLPA